MNNDDSRSPTKGESVVVAVASRYPSVREDGGGGSRDHPLEPCDRSVMVRVDVIKFRCDH